MVLTSFPMYVIMHSAKHVRARIRHAARRSFSWLAKDLIDRMESIMDQIQILTDKVTSLETSVTNAVTRVTAAQAELQATIADLKAHPAAPDLTDIIARLDKATSSLDTIDAPVTPPPAPADTTVASSGADTTVASTGTDTVTGGQSNQTV